MKHRQHVEHSALDDINIELDRNLKQITKLVAKRKELVALKKNRLQNQYRIQMDALNRGDRQATIELRQVDRELNNLLTNVESNPRLKATLNTMWNQTIAYISKNENSKTVQFWNTNKKLESDIDVSIKKLRTLDASIEGIVGQFFSIGKSIDETDQSIKQILSRKYQNHIQKAQPYSIQRQKLQDALQIKNQQRQKVKQDKVEVIKKLISLLDNLKSHRQSRMRSLLPIQDGDMPVYNQFVEGLEKIIKTKQSLHSHDQDQTKLAMAINTLQEKADEMFNNYLKKQTEENAVLEELTKCFANKLRMISLEKALIGDIIPESASRNLGETIKKCREFGKILINSCNEKSMVRQGLEKTKSTASIFDQILRSIESQRLRRKKLMEQLMQLEEYYNGIQAKQDNRQNLISELEQLALKKKQLQKRLAELASKADLDGYKKVTETLYNIKQAEEKIESQLSKTNDSLMSGQSNLQQFANGLSTEYNDILKEVLPQSWLRKHDLRKSQSILQLNRYLQRTYERLSI